MRGLSRRRENLRQAGANRGRAARRDGLQRARAGDRLFALARLRSSRRGEHGRSGQRVRDLRLTPSALGRSRAMKKKMKGPIVSFRPDLLVANQLDYAERIALKKSEVINEILSLHLKGWLQAKRVEQRKLI